MLAIPPLCAPVRDQGAGSSMVLFLARPSLNLGRLHRRPALVKHGVRSITARYKSIDNIGVAAVGGADGLLCRRHAGGVLEGRMVLETTARR